MNNIIIAKASYLYEDNCSCMYNSAIHVEGLRSMVGNTLLAVNPETAVSIATGCRLDSRGSMWVRGKKFFSSPQRSEQFWGPSSLLSSGHLRIFPLG
jgi:hypothetical protein